MERLILDTSVVIDVERGKRPLNTVIRPDDDTALAAVTVAELLVGAHLGGQQHRRWRRWFIEGLLGRVRVETYTLAVARQHGALMAQTRRAGRQRGEFDLMIAATAAATGRTVLTTDQGGFTKLEGIEVRLVT